MHDGIFQLVKRAATQLPDDVEQALCAARRNEADGGTAAATLDSILENIALARNGGKPICQDTGMITFFLKAGRGFCHEAFESEAAEAVREATRQGLLRPNCVEMPGGKNTGDNIGTGFPMFHWETDATLPEGVVEATLLLKGGGSENMSRQFSLPDDTLGAGRDLAGVRRCILQAMTQIQGCGCAPGILGVCIGGDRASGYAAAKAQLTRRIGMRSRVEQLAALERQMLEEANQLGIGPMGLGGNTTLLDVFVTCLGRHPATFFVTIAYMCWCCRRQTMRLHFRETR